MAYVAPNSTLQLFKGINLDNRYLHTIYFANATAQEEGGMEAEKSDGGYINP